MAKYSREKTAILLLFVLVTISAIPPAYPQTIADMSTEVQTMYKSSYPKASDSSESSVTVQSEYHIYKPGDTVNVTGEVSSEMREETESDSVVITMMDAQGEVVAEQAATVDSSGQYNATITLPPSAEQGEYDLNSKLEVEASVLGLLDAELVAKLESSSQFVVGTSSSFEVTAEVEGGQEQQFEVEITSNSNVDNVRLNQTEKKVAFTVEGETGTRGVAEVTIPKAMLSGEMVVLIDGQVVTAESNDVIVKSNTETEIIFEINYDHSEHDVEVQGTNVVPEFPVSTVVMAAAIGSIIAAVTFAKKVGFFNRV